MATPEFGLPSELKAEFHSVLGLYLIAESDPAGFQLEEHDGGGVRIAPGSDSSRVRVAPLRVLSPSEAEKSSAATWAAALAVAEGERLGALDAKAARVRHSAQPTHVFAVLERAGKSPLSVAWAVDPSAEPAEVTRDFLRCRYFVEQPLHRALHALPLLSEPALWASDDERAACEAELRARRAEWERAEQQQQAPARPAAAPTGGLHASASGRQVFLAWMAAGGGGAPPAAAAAAPSAAAAAPVEPREGGGAGGVWRVYTDLKQVRDGLRDARFELVGSPDDARDVLWLGEHIVDFEGAAEGGAVLNQFPHESCLTAKNLLAECARAAHGRALAWLPDAYPLPHELPRLVARWEADAAAGGAPPLFICKPWSSSRSQGVLIASELHQVLGACRPAYGPKLACEYVRSPLLVRGRKFDLRLYVAVASLRPPRFYVCRRWYARLANLPLAGAPLSERLAHLTVAKYDGVDQDFLSDRECVAWLDDDAAAAAQGWRGWPELAPRVREMLATAFAPLVDRAADARWTGGRCRALYGVDVLLAADADWRQPKAAATAAAAGPPQPVLLEVNYSPDLSSATRFCPRFVDLVFARLFADDADAPSDEWDRLEVAPRGVQ